MAHLNPDLVRQVVKQALEEDGAFQDVTTLTTVPSDQHGRGVFLAKEAGVLAGLPLIHAAFEALDPSIEVRSTLADGAFLEPGVTFAQVQGPLAPMLSAERIALNFLQRLSGVATATKRLTEAVLGLPVRVVDTRKTTPGLRALERYAVLIGGGQNHRFNLTDGVLIKDNHIAAGRSRGLTLGQVIAAAREGASHTMRIEVEVASLAEAQEAVEAKADVILLDNMTPAEMKHCVDMIGGRALTEASGGVTAENARAIAESGVDIISSGALTHSAPALDISLNIEVS